MTSCVNLDKKIEWLEDWQYDPCRNLCPRGALACAQFTIAFFSMLGLLLSLASSRRNLSCQATQLSGCVGNFSLCRNASLDDCKLTDPTNIATWVYALSLVGAITTLFVIVLASTFDCGSFLCLKLRHHYQEQRAEKDKINSFNRLLDIYALIRKPVQMSLEAQGRVRRIERYAGGKEPNYELALQETNTLISMGNWKTLPLGLVWRALLSYHVKNDSGMMQDVNLAISIGEYQPLAHYFRCFLLVKKLMDFHQSHDLVRLPSYVKEDFQLCQSDYKRCKDDVAKIDSLKKECLYIRFFLERLQATTWLHLDTIRDQLEKIYLKRFFCIFDPTLVQEDMGGQIPLLSEQKPGVSCDLHDKDLMNFYLRISDIISRLAPPPQVNDCLNPTLMQQVKDALSAVPAAAHPASAAAAAAAVAAAVGPAPAGPAAPDQP